MNELIGQTIKSIEVNDDESILAFRLSDGEVIAYITEGDCCSETWFADIVGVSALIGGTVKSVDTVDLDTYNVNDGRTRQEKDEAYGVKLTTDRGYASIVYRNSSNGYYGGDVSLYTNALPNGMVSITSDWEAK